MSTGIERRREDVEHAIGNYKSWITCPPVTRPKGMPMFLIHDASAQPPAPLRAAASSSRSVWHVCRVVPVTAMGMLTVIEPIPEAVESILYKVFGGSKVEPWVDCSVVSFFLASGVSVWFWKGWEVVQGDAHS